MTPGSALLMAAIFATLAAPVVPKSKLKMTKESDDNIKNLQEAMERFFLALEIFQDSVEDKMEEEGVTLAPETVPPPTSAPGATIKGTEATMKATEATTATKKASSEQKSSEEEGSSSRQKTKSSETTQATGTTIPQTSRKPMHTLPPFLSHRGKMYTKPGSPDGRCYCEEITEDESMEYGGGSSHRDKTGGGGSSHRNKTGGGGSSTRDKTGGGGSSHHGDKTGGGGSSHRDQTGGGGSSTGDKDGDKEPAYCFPNLENIAVDEEETDLPMHVTSSPCNVAWTVVPTSDEENGYPCPDPDCTDEPTLMELYQVNRDGLMIRTATTARKGESISTAGLYIVECNGERAAAKLLVVRSGPDCSCATDSYSSNVRLSCSVDFADGSIHPIPAIMTWMVNGQHYATDTPYKDKMDGEVFTATSIIEISDTDVNDYNCTLTFGKPTDLQYAFIATNAPEFSRSCSTPCEGGKKKNKKGNNGKTGGGGSDSGDKDGGSKSN